MKLLLSKSTCDSLQPMKLAFFCIHTVSIKHRHSDLISLPPCTFHLDSWSLCKWLEHRRIHLQFFLLKEQKNDSIQREEGLCRKHEQNWKNSQFFLGRSSPEKIQTKPFLLAKVHWPISMVLCLDFH